MARWAAARRSYVVFTRVATEGLELAASRRRAWRVALGKEAIRGAKSIEVVVTEWESTTAAAEVDERARFAGRVDIGRWWGSLEES